MAKDKPQELVLFRAGADDLAQIVKESTISVMILDRSGSMLRYGKVPQHAVNMHLTGLRRDATTDHYCMVVTFADDMRVEVPFAHISMVRPMDSYHADGYTLLWATVYAVMHELWKQYEAMLLRVHRPALCRVVIGVFSDGEDNRSPREQFPDTLQHLATMAQEAGWELLTFGIGIDGRQLAEEMGFPTDEAHAVTVAASAEGIHAASQLFSTSTMGGRRSS